MQVVPSGVLSNVFQGAALVRPVEEANFAVFVARVIEVDEQIDVAPIFVLVERPNLGAWGRDVRSPAV